MIYLTSQLVLGLRTRATAANAFVHLHPEVRSNARGDRQLLHLATTKPGPIDRASIAIPPGGNRVQAFLDLLLPDDINSESLSSTFDALSERVGNATSNEWDGALDDGGFVHSYFDPSLDPSAAFVQLREAALKAFQSTGATALRVRIAHDGAALVLQMDEPSKARLVRVHGAAWVAPTLRLSEDTVDDFEAVHGTIFPHIVQVITGMAPYHVKSLGGVEFVGADGRVVAKWPNP